VQRPGPLETFLLHAGQNPQKCSAAGRANSSANAIRSPGHAQRPRQSILILDIRTSKRTLRTRPINSVAGRRQTGSFTCRHFKISSVVGGNPAKLLSLACCQVAPCQRSQTRQCNFSFPRGETQKSCSTHPCLKTTSELAQSPQRFRTFQPCMRSNTKPATTNCQPTACLCDAHPGNIRRMERTVGQPVSQNVVNDCAWSSLLRTTINRPTIVRQAFEFCA